MKWHKKDLSILTEVYHKAITRISSHNAYVNNHECIEYARLPNSKHFLARKLICCAHKNFTSKGPCRMIHKHYLRYISVFRNSIERFFSENYQVTNVFDNPLRSIFPWIEFVQRTEPRSIGYEPDWMCYKYMQR